MLVIFKVLNKVNISSVKSIKVNEYYAFVKTVIKTPMGKQINAPVKGTVHPC